jgi:hypothetical protein
MGSDKFSLFYCLTDKGWTRLEDDRSPPDGWVRICEVEVYEGSPFGRESRRVKMIRTNPNSTAGEVDALERVFPRPSGWQTPSPELLKFFPRK